MNYLNDDYHKELADRYELRKLSLSKEELSEIVHNLGINIGPNSIEKATGGNVSGTFFAGDFVIKIQNDRERHEFLANKIVSEKFAGQIPIIKVIKYDHFDKTDYEVLVMERGKGELLLGNFPSLNQEVQTELFAQILDIAKKASEITFADFGEIRHNQSFGSFKEYISADFSKYVSIINEQKLCKKSDIDAISGYFFSHIDVFNDEKDSCLNHTDLHFGNVLHEGDKITLLFDFDGSIKGPAYLMLLKIIGAIDEPAQFVEGTEYFDEYKDKKFEFLFPVLAEKMADVFADKNLVRKLNLAGITEGLKWISENWSAEWNANQIKNLLENEACIEKGALGRSYYGRIVEKITVK